MNIKFVDGRQFNELENEFYGNDVLLKPQESSIIEERKSTRTMHVW